VLKPGFHAYSGSQFLAKIASRPGNYNGALYKKPGNSGGRVGLVADTQAGKGLKELPQGKAPAVNLVIKAPISNAEMGISSYPNPTAGKLLVEMIGQAGGPARVEVMDLSGKVLLTVDTNERFQQLDLSTLSAGLYLLKVRFNDKQYVNKITMTRH
jgi:hypothetical protein